LNDETPTRDFAGPIRRVHDLAARWGGLARSCRLTDADAFARRVGISPPGRRTPTVVVGGNVGAELGCPPAPSHALVLTTAELGLVSDGRVRCKGPDLASAVPAANLPLAQVVIAAHAPGNAPDRFDLERAQFWTDRLPGVMARAMPDRLWLRVERSQVAAGLTVQTLGQALVAIYRREFPELTAVEVLLITGGEDDVRALDPVAADARVIGGGIKKLVAVEAGVYDCPDLDCDSCADQATCDALRDVAVRYRERS
jgi:CO dehydrogenase/acetyl-CoA synthase complex beta subunit